MLLTGSLQKQLQPLSSLTWDIEVGACDFDNINPNPEHQTLFVEPVPYYAQKLRNRFSDYGNVEIEQCAASNTIGKTSIKFVGPELVKEEWVRGISHLTNNSSNLIDRNLNLGYDLGPTITEEVPTATIDSIISKYNINKIGIFKLDVEGHELKVLEGFSWSVLPEIVKIEHKFIDLRLLLDILKSKGYDCWYDSEDVFGYLT